jgi:hypothetical protein
MVFIRGLAKCKWSKRRLGGGRRGCRSEARDFPQMWVKPRKVNVVPSASGWVVPVDSVLVDSPHCSACTDEMYLTMIVPPFGSPYGLKVYTCPKCGRSESYLITAPSKAA